MTLWGSQMGDDGGTLTAVLKDLIDAQGNLKVVVDLQKLFSLDLVGARVLRVAADWARGHGAAFRLADPSFGVCQVLHEVGLSDILLFSRIRPLSA